MSAGSLSGKSRQDVEFGRSAAQTDSDCLTKQIKKGLIYILKLY